jgi:hypothetical protein
VVGIVWGLPTAEEWTEALEDNVVLGGRERDERDPSWKCKQCNADVYCEELKESFPDDATTF